jgi:Uma2 family endonuclease
MTATLVEPTATVATVETLAELLERVSEVPPARIRMHPYPGTATERDVIEAEAKIGRLCELVDGVLVEKPMGYYESSLAGILIFELHLYLRQHDLGIVLGEAGMVHTAPEQVRMPDVSFLSWDHFPNRIMPPGSILNIVPDLAVEILSPTNTLQEMERKRREYFAGGTRLVWELDPIARRVRVYTAVDHFTDVSEDGTLEGGTVLPDFKLPVRAWFDRAGKRAEG